MQGIPILPSANDNASVSILFDQTLSLAMLIRAFSKDINAKRTSRGLNPVR